MAAAATAFRDAPPPTSVTAANQILEKAAAADKLVYTAVYRCCDRAMEQQRSPEPQHWLR